MFTAKVGYCGIKIHGFDYVSTELWESFEVHEHVFIAEHPELGVWRVYNTKKQFACCVYQVQTLEAQIGGLIRASKKYKKINDEAKKAAMKIRAGRNDFMRVLNALEREGLTNKHFK